MVALGHKTTLPITLTNMIDHAKAVSRGFQKDLESQPLVICDMPFLSYQCGEERAVENAGRVIKETYAKGVKLEGAEPEVKKVISRLIRMGIPVMGHLGLTPQSYLNQGLKKQGEKDFEQTKIKEEAKCLENLGCFSLVLEHIPELLAKEISEQLKIPTIGIGAGKYCDGQIRVTADLLGLNDKQPPFSSPLVNGKEIFIQKLKDWIDLEKIN